jgi:hypothetical protein
VKAVVLAHGLGVPPVEIRQVDRVFHEFGHFGVTQTKVAVRTATETGYNIVVDRLGDFALLIHLNRYA